MRRVLNLKFTNCSNHKYDGMAFKEKKNLYNWTSYAFSFADITFRCVP